MTVVASSEDVTGVHGNGPGKGTQVLNAVAGLQAVVSGASPAFIVAAKAQLNLLQIEAVDYFMGSYWVSADQILATFAPLPVNNKYGAYITAQLNAITARLAQINQAPPQYSQALVYGNQAPQYPAYMPPYPNTPPDGYWYALQTQLVDFLMANGIVTAGSILATMTGNQSYAFNYNTNGQFFSPYSEGDVSQDL